MSISITRFGLVILLVCGACFIRSAHAAANPQRIEVSRDAWISSYNKEREGNNGGSPRLKLKSIQEMFLIDFDPAPLRGKRVLRAQLHLHIESPETLGRVTVSTITDPWIEGNGKSYAIVPGASSFLWAATQQRRWAGNAPDITSVTLGNGGSRWGFGDASPADPQGWQAIPIDPAVVQDRIDGLSHGFLVMDDVGSEYTRTGNAFSYRPLLNRYVASREGPRQTAPYFTFWLENSPPATPSPKPNSAAAAPPAPAVMPPISAAPAAASAVLPIECHTQFGDPLQSLSFRVARNEALGFFIAADPHQITLTAPAGLQVSLMAAPRVEGQLDPLVPFEATTTADASFIEIYVPQNTPPGLHAGKLTVAGQSLPFTVTVWNFTLPDRLSFIPQMNCYSLPGHDSDYYRLAHEHRTSLNRLRYGWTGKVSAEDVPHRKADGSWDWTDFDRKFGPLLDGSAFKSARRASVPIDAFYLPINENWPMDHQKHFRGGYWVESAYGDAYWQELRAISREFAVHLAARKWTEPIFEFYLNNKVYFKHDRGDRWDACSAPWIFDEPMHTQDFWALRRFGLEFWRGTSGIPGPHLAFRIDISRPEWQRDLLDGVDSVEVLSGALRTHHQAIAARTARLGNLVYMYGSPNAIGEPNVIPAAWCVETWALGGDGVVPWQTIGRAESWTKPDSLAMFYPTPQGPVPSIRLKSFRAGQQLVEYLTMYAALSGDSRAAVAAAVRADPAFAGVMQKKSETDAGASAFNALSAASFEILRQRLGTWLDQKAPASRDRWHDPRPALRDPGMVRPIQVTLSGGS